MAKMTDDQLKEIRDWDNRGWGSYPSEVGRLLEYIDAQTAEIQQQAERIRELEAAVEKIKLLMEAAQTATEQA